MTARAGLALRERHTVWCTIVHYWTTIGSLPGCAQLAAVSEKQRRVVEAQVNLDEYCKELMEFEHKALLCHYLRQVSCLALTATQTPHFLLDPNGMCVVSTAAAHAAPGSDYVVHRLRGSTQRRSQLPQRP